jgi:hypothetical protein
MASGEETLYPLTGFFVREEISCKPKKTPTAVATITRIPRKIHPLIVSSIYAFLSSLSILHESTRKKATQGRLQVLEKTQEFKDVFLS